MVTIDVEIAKFGVNVLSQKVSVCQDAGVACPVPANLVTEPIPAEVPPVRATAKVRGQ
jgi:hypothetical protein